DFDGSFVGRIVGYCQFITFLKRVIVSLTELIYEFPHGRGRHGASVLSLESHVALPLVQGRAISSNLHFVSGTLSEAACSFERYSNGFPVLNLRKRYVARRNNLGRQNRHLFFELRPDRTPFA